MSLQELQTLEREWVMPTYSRMPVELVRGEGARVWDAEGKSYLDFLGGVAVCSVGHCHPDIVAAIRGQAGALLHVSNLAYSAPAMRLAERLGRDSLGGKVFFANSGTEANECAIKLVRKHAHGRGIADPEIVTLEGSFHGRTFGALSATPGLADNPAFAPMLAGFRRVPRDDPKALRDAVGARTAAVMLEVVQGESGVWPISDEMLAATREACNTAGALLVMDEIQTGVGRTGSLWAYEQTAVRPDVITSAKALGGGLPIGACVTTPQLGDVFEPGDHGSTFAGGPLVASAALVVLDLVDDPDVLRTVRELGGSLVEGVEGIDGITDVRGRGLMVGASLADGLDAAAVQGRALEAGLIVNVPVEGILRLLPPLLIGTAEVDEAVAILQDAIHG